MLQLMQVHSRAMTILGRAKPWSTELHYWASSLLALALVPLLRTLNLPVRFDWALLVSAYWLVLAAQSIFVATLLYLIGAGPAGILRPFLLRIRREKIRVALALVFFLILLWAFTWLKALILTVDAVAVLEFRERLKPAALKKTTLRFASCNLPFFWLLADFRLQRHHLICALLRRSGRGFQYYRQVVAWRDVGVRSVSLGSTKVSSFVLSFP